MWKILLLLVFLFLGVASGVEFYDEELVSDDDIGDLGTGEDYGDLKGENADYSGEADSEYENEEDDYGTNVTPEDTNTIFQFHQYNENKTVNKIHQHHDSLIVLFGSEESIYSSVYRDLHDPDYLSLAKVKLNIKEALNDPEKSSHLNSTQRDEIAEAINKLDERMSELAKVIPESWLMQSLTEQGDLLASILPATKVYEHLYEISTDAVGGMWSCDDGDLVRLWRDVVDTHHSQCDLEDRCDDNDLNEAIQGIVHIVQALQNVTIHNGAFRDFDGVYARNKARLLYMVSQKRNRVFATRMMGSVQELEDLVQYILCKELTLQVIETILTKFTNPSMIDFESMVSNTDDLLTLVDIQTTLGEITGDIASAHSESGNVRASFLPNLGRHILDSYMDLVDSAVNINSTEIWAQMSLEEVNEKLHHMLLSNERYVGTVSDVILSGNTAGNNNNYTLEKDSLSVSISQVELQQNSQTIAQFEYGDTLIWTDDMGALDHSDGKDVKVYALRYKSWSHMIRDILIKRFDLVAANSTSTEEGFVENHSRHARSIQPSIVEITQNKSFIGKGGVVSLSTKQNGVKRSVPVTYWIGFEDESFANLTKLSKNSQSFFCLSCEYLQAETITWESHGCHVVGADEKGVTCKCNHTTNFAAFMMPAEMIFELTEQESAILKILSIVGSTLSVIGLLVSLIVFYLVRNLVRNERFKAHTNLSVALLGVHITFLLGDFFIRDNIACATLTVLSHYFLLATFMWMLVEGIFLYLYVVQVFLRSRISSYNWMYAVGWLIPAVIVAISAGYGIPRDLYVMPIGQEEKEDKFDPQCPEDTFMFPFDKTKEVDINNSDQQKYARCWLNTTSGMIWSFLAPAILVLVFNTIIMCKTLQICVKSLKTSSEIRSRNKSYNSTRKSSPPQPHSSRYEYAHGASDEHHHNSETYDHLHGQANRLQSHGRSTPTRIPIVVSTSPCLLQVTTEEEESKKAMLEKHEKDSSSSTENIAHVNAGRNRSLHPDGGDSSEVPSRYHPGNGDSTRVYNNRTSVMYRNSVSNSPRIMVKSPSFGSKMAHLESSRKSEEKVHFFRDAKTAVKGAVVLLPILGVPWVCGFLAHLSQVFTFLFVILNSTQGIAIFIVYCIFNGEVRRAIQRRLVRRSMKNAVDGGVRRTSSTSTARSFLRFGRRRSTITTSA